MKTQYYTATSIDGYLADENNSLDWLFQFGEIESMKDHYPTFISKVGAMAMGSTTYEWVVAYENLLDEIILSVAPVMLGSGAPLLPRSITIPPMKLVDIQKHGDAFAILTYEVQRRPER